MAPASLTEGLARLPREEVEGLLVEAIEGLRNRSFATMPELATYLERRISSVADPRFQAVVQQRKREADARAQRAITMRDAARNGSAGPSAPASHAAPPPQQNYQQQPARAAAAPPPSSNIPRAPPAYHAAAEGGIIFGCSNETHDECMEKRLLGVPESQLNRVQRIQPFNTALFLYNFQRRKLYGVFEATGPGALNIDPTAWRGAMMASRKLSMLGKSTSQGSPFPAQVRFQVVHDFPALAESKFANVVTWKNDKMFDFLLTADQVSKLMTLFIAEEQERTGRRR